MKTPSLELSTKTRAKETKSWVYLFDELDKVESIVQPSNWDAVRSLLGGKGANLFEMTRLGLPVKLAMLTCNTIISCHPVCGIK